jgi:3,4-dihydroxy 2-butanone 4-phosphate synthase/GTP cyclohydrolase II
MDIQFSMTKNTSELEMKLNSVTEAIEAIRQGEVIIVVDDEDRENEGDFICAAENVTPEVINFMATHGRGLICTPILEERAEDLELHMMVDKNTALHETAFTVSIDLIGHGCTTGISAYDRATGIRALTRPQIKANNFGRPGHIFPLRAKSGGVLRRTGHTEAAVDLARLAGFYPAGVLVEILNEDGTMARLPDLIGIAEKFGLKIISIKDLVEYRMSHERLIERLLSVKLPEEKGGFQVTAYKQKTNGDIHFAITLGKWNPDEPVPVRVHSSTETGGILGTLFDDYGLQLKRALRKIKQEGKGVLLYMNQTEKQDSVLKRLKAYDPTTESSLSNDQRDFGIGAQILRDVGVEKMLLLTRSARKRVGITGYGLEIVDTLDF